jgi:catechol 2,3-dioxygenase-like lactoylglutathione lyase family enzyme
VTIHHVAVPTRRSDVDACLAFWALLGYERVEPPATLRDRATWLERDGRQIHLQYLDDAPSGHVALVATQAEVDALAAAGHAVEPRRAHWGAPRWYVRDPAGHLVELMLAPPG